MDRSTWAAVYERDVDLVLLDLLHSAPAFRTKLLTEAAPDVEDLDPVNGFLGAWHSVTDDVGHESDLEAEWRLRGGGTLTVLIEDKLAARCQPDQATRYLARAERYRSSGRSTQTRTLLVSPSWYPKRYWDDVAPFERYVAIDDIARWCEEGVVGDRGRYIAALLRHALARTAPAPTEAGSAAERVVPVYALLRKILGASKSELQTNTRAEWAYFTFPGQRRNDWLRYRMFDHWVELVFAKTTVPEAVVATVFADAPLRGASIASRGRTETAIWHPVPEIDFAADIAPQRDRLLTTIAAAEMLKDWYLQQAERLHMAGAGGGRAQVAPE